MLYWMQSECMNNCVLLSFKDVGTTLVNVNCPHMTTLQTQNQGVDSQAPTFGKSNYLWSIQICFGLNAQLSCKQITLCAPI